MCACGRVCTSVYARARARSLSLFNSVFAFVCMAVWLCGHADVWRLWLCLPPLRYLKHPDRHKVNFTLLLQAGFWFHGQEAGSNETWPQEIARYISYFRMDGYQKVDIGGISGRPVVFINGHVNQSYLQDLLSASKAALGVYPYVVSMSNQQLPEIDAQSRYGGGTSTPEGAPYVENLANEEVALWRSWATKGMKTVPTVSAGRDARPRAEYPMPWNVGHWSKSYVKDPTMDELESHVADGLDFVSKNPIAAEANLMLLSAWNEHDEGHWIAPALPQYGGTEKLDAVKRAIDKHAARPH